MKLKNKEKRVLLKEKIKILKEMEQTCIERHVAGEPSERIMQIVRLDQIEQLLKT